MRSEQRSEMRITPKVSKGGVMAYHLISQMRQGLMAMRVRGFLVPALKHKALSPCYLTYYVHRPPLKTDIRKSGIVQPLSFEASSSG